MDYPEVSALSLCSGIGGLEGGVHRALRRVDRSLRVVAYSEIEEHCLAVVAAGMAKGFIAPAPFFSSVKTFPYRNFRGKVCGLIAGFPCQPFSSAGKRAADDDPRHLFPFIIRGIEEIRPGFVFLENVESILSATLKGEGWVDPPGTSVLLHVCRELERRGYTVETDLFSAAEIGASHARRRIFILAWDERFDLGVPRESVLQALAEFHRVREPAHFFNPLPPGADQWAWEPPRTSRAMAHPHRSRLQKRVEFPGVRGGALGPRPGEDPGSNGGSSLAHTPGERGFGRETGSGDAANAGQSPQHQIGVAYPHGIQCHGDEFLWRELKPAIAGDRGEALADPVRVHGSSGAASLWRGRGVRGSGEEGGAGGIPLGPVDGDPDGIPSWMDESELSGLGDEELAEIHAWLSRCDSRVDELRAIGNSVYIPTAELAFLTLLARILDVA